MTSRAASRVDSKVPYHSPNTGSLPPGGGQRVKKIIIIISDSAVTFGGGLGFVSQPDIRSLFGHKLY